MRPLLSFGETGWGALFFGLWLLVGFMHLRSLWTGHIIGFSGSRAIKRNKRPTRFWVAWLALAWPFVFLPLLVVIGLIFQTVGAAK